MTKNTSLIRFMTLLFIAGSTLTACQNSDKGEPADLKTADSTQMTPADRTGVTPPDIAKPDTTNHMTDTTKKKKPLVLVIDNLESPSAPVEVSVYTSEDKFPSEKGQLKKYRFTPAGNTLTAEINDLDYGQYAVATYQDLDGDGKIAKNMIGIPTDPFAFSNNYVPKIKAPAFKDCAFAYDDKSASVSITMIRK